MLIGGPNQSHKVNFKELLPMRERCPRHGLSFAPSILFLIIFQKIISGKEPPVSWRLLSPGPRLWRRVLKEGRTENANSRTGLKPFLKKVSPPGVFRYQPMAWAKFLTLKNPRISPRPPADFLYPIY